MSISLTAIIQITEGSSFREKSTLFYGYTGLSQGISPASVQPRAHLLTANVKRRNLLRSTGFSRAVPDFMDSHICQKKSVKAGYQASLSFSLPGKVWSWKAPGSSFLQAQHHLPHTMKWVVTSLCPLHTASPSHTPSTSKPSEGAQAPPLSRSQHRGGNQAIFMSSQSPSANIYLLSTIYQAHQGYRNKRHGQSLPSRHSQSRERDWHKRITSPPCRICCHRSG